MPKFFVANATRQNQEIYYRLEDWPEGSAAGAGRVVPPRKSPPILPGRQIPLHGDLTVNEVGSLVRQLSAYGAVEAKETGRLGPVAPYVFSIDTPVPPQIIMDVFEHNKGVLKKDGQLRREAAAIAADHVVRESGDTKEFEVTIEQDDETETSGKRLEEGYRVGAMTDKVPEGARKLGPRGKYKPRKPAGAAA